MTHSLILAGVLAATPAPSEPEASAGTRPIAHRTSRPLSIQTALGASYAELFSVPTYSGELSFAVGKRFGVVRGYTGGHVQHGRTEQGLPLWGLHVGPSAEMALGPLRLGGEIRLGGLMFERITTGAWLLSPSVGAAIQVGIDVVSLSRVYTLFVRGAVRGDYYFEPFVWNPHLSLGLQWDDVGDSGALE